MPISTLVINKQKVMAVVYFIILTTIATTAPLLGHIQPVTGPIVNATLFLSIFFLGPSAGILVGLFPSLIALSSGLLPASLAPMIPFIMVSNALLVIMFQFLKTQSFFWAVFISSAIKFIFLWASSFVIIGLLLKQELAGKVLVMLSWPQFFTALAGGLLAFLVIKFLTKNKTKTT